MGASVYVLSLWMVVSLFLAGCGPFSGHKSPDLTDPTKREQLEDQARIAGLPTAALNEAINYINNNKKLNFRSDHLAILNFDQHSSEKRFYLVDLQNGAIQTLLTAHGVNSDAKNTGYATQFSNRPNSRMSSLGFYRVAEIYTGKYGASMRMDGLEPLNNNARKRAIVLHPANYVRDDDSFAGRSWGCPAVDYQHIESVIKKLNNGGLLYIYVQSIDEHREFAARNHIEEPGDETTPRVDEAEDAPTDGE